MQVNTWGKPLDKGVLSLTTEYIDSDKIGPNDLLVKMRYACIHPADVGFIEKKMELASFNHSLRENIIPTKFGTEGIYKRLTDISIVGLFNFLS